MTALTNRPLLITVAPKDGESLNSVIARASAANIETRPGRFVSTLGWPQLRTEYSAFTRYEKVAELAGMLSIDSPSLARIFHRPWDKAHTTLVDWFTTPIPRAFLDAQARRVSPMSLKRGGYHRALWMVRPLSYCPESFELLTSSCPLCRSSLGWSRTLGITICEHCKRSLKNVSRPQLERRFWPAYSRTASLISPELSLRERALGMMPKPFCDWSPGSVFTSLVEVGALSKGRVFSALDLGKIHRGNYSSFTTADLLRGYGILVSWPNGFREYLRRAIRAALESGWDPIAQTEFLFRKKMTSPPELLEMLKAAAVEAFMDEGIALRANGPARRAAPNSRETVSTLEAEAEFGIARKTLTRLKNGSVSMQARRSGKSGVTLYRRVQLREAIRVVRANLTTDQAFRTTGIPEFAIRAFVDSGLLKEVPDRDAILLAGSALINKVSVQALVRRLTALEPGCGVASTLVSPFRGAYHPLAFVRSVEALLAGTLSPVTIVPGDKPILSRILVNECDVLQLTHTTQAERCTQKFQVSGATAATVLGVNELIVSWACRTGLLPAVPLRCNRLQIWLHDLAEFDRTYVANTSLADAMRVSGRVMARTMREAGFKPVGMAKNRPVWYRRDGDQLLFGQGAQSAPR